MSAHTPEPWRWLNDSVLVGAHGRRPVVLMGEQLQQRGENGLLQAFDPSSPDGRLIAAAPEMAVLLRDYVYLHEQDTYSECSCMHCVGARALLARIEGKS